MNEAGRDELGIEAMDPHMVKERSDIITPGVPGANLPKTQSDGLHHDAKGGGRKGGGSPHSQTACVTVGGGVQAPHYKAVQRPTRPLVVVGVA